MRSASSSVTSLSSSFKTTSLSSSRPRYGDPGWDGRRYPMSDNKREHLKRRLGDRKDRPSHEEMMGWAAEVDEPLERIENWFWNNSAALRKAATRAYNGASKVLAKAKANLRAEKSKRGAGTRAIQHRARIQELTSVVSLQEKAVMEAKNRLEDAMADWEEQRAARKNSPRRPRMFKRGDAKKQCGGAIAGRMNESEKWWSEDEKTVAAALLSLKNVWVMDS